MEFQQNRETIWNKFKLTGEAIGNWAFSVAGVKVWNDLPVDLVSARSLAMKTHSFQAIRRHTG